MTNDKIHIRKFGGISNYMLMKSPELLFWCLKRFTFPKFDPYFIITSSVKSTTLSKETNEPEPYSFFQ